MYRKVIKCEKVQLIMINDCHFSVEGFKTFFYFSLDFSCMSRRRISIACLVPLIALCNAAILDSRGRHSNKFYGLGTISTDF